MYGPGSKYIATIIDYLTLSVTKYVSPFLISFLLYKFVAFEGDYLCNEMPFHSCGDHFTCLIYLL